MIGDGTASSKSPIYLVWEDSTEIDERGVLIAAPWINELQPLTDVELTVDAGNTDDTQIAVRVKQSCDGTPVSGLIVDDFSVKTTGGVEQDISGVNEQPEEPGLYIIEPASAFTAGNVNLVASGLLTIIAYESTGAKTFTVV
jgi:hypothetical protein